MAEELQAIVLAFDLIKWSLPAIGKFPRNQRFVLGERMERNLYEILERLVEAKYTKEKAQLLRRVNLNLEIFRFQVRLAKEMGFLGASQYEFVSTQVDDLGRRVGGWSRAVSARSKPDAASEAAGSAGPPGATGSAGAAG